MLPILRWPYPRLSQQAARVERFDDELARMAGDMLDTMYAAKGRGLAAPQVGRMLRLFVMDEGWKEGRPDPVIVVNPVIRWTSPAVVTGPEGCLSIPGVTAMVQRSSEIRLHWQDLSGADSERPLAGFAAICAQHEIDHLDGIVTFDRVNTAERAILERDYAA